MLFSNLTIFRFPASLDFSELEAQAATGQVRPIGPLELASGGFMPIFGHGDDTLVHRGEDSIWVALGGEEKILPAAAINARLQKKLDEIEAKDGRRPGGKTRKRLKDDLLHELLPNALTKPWRIDAVIDTKLGLLIVNASSRKASEVVASALRGVMGSFPAMPINAEIAPQSVLTGWIAGEPLPDLLQLGEAAELRDPIEGGAVVRVKDMELRCEEIDKHLESGKQVTKLALTLGDHVAFELADDLVMRKVKFLEGAVSELDENPGDDLRAELDARFTLMVGELRVLFGVVETALKLSRVE